MSESPDTSAREERFEPFELAIYRLSPLGFWGTTLALFLLAIGSYALISTLTQQPPLIETRSDGTRGIPSVTWIAFVLSLIFTAGPALTENGRRYWARFAPQVATTVAANGRDQALDFGDGRLPLSTRGMYRLMALLGVIAGLGQNALIMLLQGAPLHLYLGSVGLWFVLISPPLFAVGFRAGYDVAREGGALKRLIRDHVEVDLFHLDRLSVYGSIGLRAALSWMVMAAILLLFLVDANQLWSGLIGVGFAIIGAVSVFTSAVRPVHDRIRAAKTAELDRIHEAMSQQRQRALAGDPEAASALAGLTDYEIWIEQRPEWPLSPGVTTRFAFYILIPVVPIAGSYLFEKIADFMIAGGS
jgi:hypothetical protein